ncbi:MAG: nucleotidyltransferase family protein [Rhodobacteraceae bacterium]|nr:nucleotidyltransferase family protein [Paracoccaceae bacterium]
MTAVDFNVILLAAGLSRRMGSQNKLLLDWAGRPVIRHVARTYLAAVGPHLWVVTGFDADRIRAALAGLSLRYLHNENYSTGQQSSVAKGLAAAAEASATLIGLGDQPLLTPADIGALMAAHNRADTRRISIPHNGVHRGNPIIIPHSLRARILARGTQPGCRKFTRSNPDLVNALPLDSAGFYTDIDTPEDYAALQTPHAGIGTDPPPPGPGGNRTAHP